MSDFKELEKMFVKIVVNEDARPFQWIYAVDDAWRWPNRMQLEVSGKACRPVFTDYICGKTIAVGKEKITPQKATPKRQAGADTPQLQNTTQAQDNSLKRLTQCFGQEDNNSDADTAEALIHFIQERFSNSNKKENYGLCFCSFEYFQTLHKITLIDR